MEIYVGNLSYQTDESSLTNAFSAHGVVDRVQIISDKFTGRSKGFAFVTMNDLKEAQNAMDALNGSQLDGRPITVNQARPREERSFGGGGGGGGPRREFRGGGGGGGGGRRDSRGGGRY
jgi:RNA recognition motif-containing protein